MSCVETGVVAVLVDAEFEVVVECVLVVAELGVVDVLT